jgi:hypothetical protein
MIYLNLILNSPDLTVRETEKSLSKFKEKLIKIKKKN